MVFAVKDHSRRERVVERRRFSFVDWVAMVFSVGVAVGMVLSWAARWVSPAVYGFMSVMGLLVPVFFVLNFLCLLYWVIRWRSGVWLPLVIFFVGVWGVGLFFRPDLTRDYGDVGADRSLVGVMSYNVRGMMSSSPGGGMRSSMREVAGVVDSLRPDVLCVQEFQATSRNPAGRFEGMIGAAYHYKVKRLGDGGEYGWGNAIYSKFPIAGSGHLDFEGTNNSILWADVAVGRDTVRVFCVHLQTTSIKSGDEEYLAGAEFVEDDGEGVRRIVGKLSRNYVIRAGQAEALAGAIAASPYGVVVCGDFNDTPSSWVYRVVSRGLRDGFREAGQGFGYSYRGFYGLLRIDYVLHSPVFECVDYGSPSFDYSDHNPVFVRLRLR